MRAIGNRGAGAIAGVRAPIAGRVSMDLVTLDVTDVPRACGRGARSNFSATRFRWKSWRDAAGTAPYEILTSLGAARAAPLRGVAR